MAEPGQGGGAKYGDRNTSNSEGGATDPKARMNYAAIAPTQMPPGAQPQQPSRPGMSRAPGGPALG